MTTERSVSFTGLIIFVVSVIWLGVWHFGRPFIGAIAIQSQSGRLMYVFGYWSGENDYPNPLWFMLAAAAVSLPLAIAWSLMRKDVADKSPPLGASLMAGAAFGYLFVAIGLMVMRLFA